MATFSVIALSLPFVVADLTGVVSERFPDVGPVDTPHAPDVVAHVGQGLGELFEHLFEILLDEVPCLPNVLAVDNESVNVFL
ncbi:MAG: hypothetical protein GY679_00040 [Mycoplasma sp.]|nr:hypothetical protein [Mycoplasma sp.]